MSVSLGGWPFVLGVVWAAAGLSRCDGPDRARAGRLWGLLLGAAFAHVGWVAVHVPGIVAAAGPAGPLLALADPLRGLSLLFVPAGPVVLRAWRRDGLAALDADLRALVPALAVARLGCVALGCCGGRAWPVELAEGMGRSGPSLVPAALLSFVGLLLLALVTRRPGRGRWALVGIGGLRLVLEPLRAPPPHGGDTTWVFVVACCWSLAGVAWIAASAPCVRAGVSWIMSSAWCARPGASWIARSRRHTRAGRQKSSPSSNPSRTGPVELPSPMAPAPPVARNSSASRSFGVPSRSGSPRTGGVRHMRKPPVRMPSRS